jgi:hypothetical protein
LESGLLPPLKWEACVADDMHNKMEVLKEPEGRAAEMPSLYILELHSRGKEELAITIGC